jgi:hypothetical protein
VADSTFDLNDTLRWVLGVLQDPHGTAAAYRETQAPWQATFLRIALPVFVAAGLLGLVLSWMSGRPTSFGVMAGAPLWMLFALAWSVVYVLVAAFLFDFFAGVFGGTRNYDAAMATLGLALVPAALGSALNPLPWLGWLIGLVASIYSLVLAYQFVPVFMSVPEDKRVVHFVTSIVAAVVLNIVVSLLLALLLVGSAGSAFVVDDAAAPVTGSSGMFGGFERQADVAEQASRDTYDPPGDGRVTEAQVREFARVLERTAELRGRLGQRFEKRDGEEVSFGDLFGGVSDAVRMGTAEMEVVKTAGGNWAEHQWVRNQLETARIQRDGNAAIEHNYAMYEEYREALERSGF